MKKGLLLIVIVVAAVFVYFNFFYKNNNSPSAPKDQPLAISKNSDAFNKPFNELLNNYYALEDALVNWDTAKAGASAKAVAELASRVPYDSLKADSGLVKTAKSFSTDVIAKAQDIANAPTIDKKRESFYTLSENLYNIIRTVHYDQAIIYHDKCPMAFGENEAGYWITTNREIVNPYFGNKHPKYHSGMLGCGSVEDSIDFVAK